MKTDEEHDKEVERFKTDVSKFSGNYPEFCVIVTTESRQLLWKSTNRTWATGACTRYLACVGEQDKHEERLRIEDDNEN